ncbi:MAG: sigma-70 family RNA polymerase sigma factor [Isosphaeraceae bacterium]
MSTQALEQQLEATDPDVRLMLQVRADVQGAFETLVERYQHRLLGVVANLVGRPEEAEDITQEVFLRIYRARKGYRPRARFSTWVFTIANNLVRNQSRGKGRHPTVPLQDDDTGARPKLPADARTLSRDGTPSAQLRKVELSEVVREALNLLGDESKLAVLLNKFEGMSYAQIGEVMGRSEPAVKSLLARARNQLREQLDPYLKSGQRGPNATRPDMPRPNST